MLFGDMFLPNHTNLKSLTLLVALSLSLCNNVLALEPDQTEIIANHLEGTAQEQIRAEGSVEVKRNNQTLNSEWLTYEQPTNRAQAGDTFKLTQENSTICGTILDYKLDDRIGFGDKPVFDSFDGTRRIQGVGDKILFQGKDKYEIQKTSFNTCKPGDGSWYIRANTVDLDYIKNVGTAKHANLVFKGVPILYSPWLDFPLDGNRKSGLLVPTFQFGTDGFTFAVPYYFNLAPNYDLTIAPGIITDRGAMLDGEFRYLMPNYAGKIRTNLLPNDRKAHKDRHLWSLQHDQVLAPNLTFGYDFNQVSDKNYFRDFGNRSDIASNVNLNREAWLRYGFGIGSASAYTSLRVQDYQTLQNETNSVDNPYARLPELLFNLNQPIDNMNLSLMSEWTYFDSNNKQTGSRIVAYPNIQWDFSKSWGFLRPKIGYHYTQYQLNSFNNLEDRSVSRGLPILSLDSGLSFERDTSFKGSSFTQTLEPRLFYTYIPTKEQNNLPNFDTAENDFNFTQLFTENRFSGEDRINSANQMTFAITTRYLDNETGLEKLRLDLGKRFYFDKDNITLSGKLSKREEASSDFLARISSSITDNLRFNTDYHYNQTLKKTERINSSLHYRPASGKAVGIRYRYGRDEEIYPAEYGELKQIDLALQWPIAKNYYIVARHNYSLAQSKALEQLLGVEYNQGCWGFRLIGQRYVSGRKTTKNAVFFQLELKDLGGLGNDPFETLRLAIPGYSKINEVSR